MNALIFTSDHESLHTFCSKALFIQTLTKIMKMEEITITWFRQISFHGGLK